MVAFLARPTGGCFRSWVTVALLFGGVYPFLSTTHRVKADILVVEGWVHEYAIQAAVDEFKSGSYKRVFTTGGPVDRNWRIHQ